jgi:SagB-type dehydrogenase family enzyme
LTVEPGLWAEFERARRVAPLSKANRPPPPSRSRPEGERIAATRPDDTALAALLDRRRSERCFGPLTFDALSSVLVGAARLISYGPAEDGYQRSWRTYPSAGGRHAIDMVAAVGDVEGLRPGLWYFDPALLDFVSYNRSAAAAIDEVRQALEVTEPPPAAVFAVATLERTLSRYPAGTSLVWRDCGAALFALHLRAAELGLASCITATCGAVVFDGRRGLVDVGALALGGRPATGR